MQCLSSKDHRKGSCPHHIWTIRKRYPIQRVCQILSPKHTQFDYLTRQQFLPQIFRRSKPRASLRTLRLGNPRPRFLDSNGYAIVRADERGLGQSPGKLDTMSRGTSEAFFDVVEWAAEQPWSSGKVGLLGISYYAGSQWRVAARKPKGLAAIVPWEGMSDYYRDRCRHGGILSNAFIKFWWDRQVVTNHYGKTR